MAYNTMSIVRQTPYMINNNMNFVKKKQEEDDESSASSRSSQSNESQTHVNPEKSRGKDIQQQLADSKAYQQKAIESRDANLKNATVNIAQILKDFRGTIKAIGSSPELTEEAEAYLALVEKQAYKEVPDVKLIRSNLKNASMLLDNYITETLQRPSKVVENWIDALFLQQINYKFNEEEINPQFLVKFPDQKNNEEENERNSSQEDEEESSEEEQSKKTVVIPQDEKLKSLFVQAKKQSYANNSKKAMELFKLALDRAIEVEDKETESKVLFEIGKIYDKNDYLAQALTSYNKSLAAAKDTSVKTKAHYSMAQIYDDVAQFESAINHYMSSISFAGESENLTAQSISLTKIGNIFSDEYKQETFDFLSVAESLSEQTDSPKTKGYVNANIANAFNRFNKPKSALKYYSTAVIEYDKARTPEKVAINYKRAAELMQDYNNPQKAKKLFKKALQKARQTEDINLMTEIHEALSTM